MLLLLVHLLSLAAPSSQLDGLGPGSGPWNSVNAQNTAQVGLDQVALDTAGASIGTMGPAACVAVAKNGVLVLDETYGFGRGKRPLEMMSAAKTITGIHGRWPAL